MDKIFIIGEVSKDKYKTPINEERNYLTDSLEPSLQDLTFRKYDISVHYYRNCNAAVDDIQERIQKIMSSGKENGKKKRLFVLIYAPDLEKEENYQLSSVNLVKTLRKEKIKCEIIIYSFAHRQKQAKKAKGAQHFIQKYQLWDIVKCLEGKCSCSQLIMKAKEEKNA